MTAEIIDIFEKRVPDKRVREVLKPGTGHPTPNGRELKSYLERTEKKQRDFADSIQEKFVKKIDEFMKSNPRMTREEVRNMLARQLIEYDRHHIEAMKEWGYE